MDSIERQIFSKSGFSYGEVINYYPDTQSISVKLIPSGIETTDMPIRSSFAGNEIGEIKPYKKGQQVIVGFINSLNNPFLIGSAYNKIQKAPTKKGERKKYGVLTNQVVEPDDDYVTVTKNNILLISDKVGVVVNSAKHISFVADNPISIVSQYVNQLGNININGLTDSVERKIDDLKDDMNQKFKQCISLATANKSQLSKMGKLTQLLTIVVRMIGKSPIMVIDIFDVFPALSGAPFTKFFQERMTDLKAIQYFNTENLGKKLAYYGLKEIRSQVKEIDQIIQKGEHYADYINYLDFDEDNLFQDSLSKLNTIIVQELPQFNDTKNKALRVVNKINDTIRRAINYFDMLEKNWNEITNSAFFKKDNKVGDFPESDGTMIT